MSQAEKFAQPWADVTPQCTSLFTPDLDKMVQAGGPSPHVSHDEVHVGQDCYGAEASGRF